MELVRLVFRILIILQKGILQMKHEEIRKAISDVSFKFCGRFTQAKLDFKKNFREEAFDSYLTSAQKQEILDVLSTHFRLSSAFKFLTDEADNLLSQLEDNVLKFIDFPHDTELKNNIYRLIRIIHVEANIDNLPLDKLSIIVDQLVTSIKKLQHDKEKAQQNLGGMKKAYWQQIGDLLDQAVGLELVGKNSDTIYPNLGSFFFDNELDVTNLNFLISFKGEPVTNEMLANCPNFTHTSMAITSYKHVKRLPVERQQLLYKQIEEHEKRLGRLVNEHDTPNFVPLYRSVMAGNLQAVEARLGAGVDPNEKEEGPSLDLMLEIGPPFVDIVNFDMQGGATPIVMATVRRFKDIINMLVNNPKFDKKTLNIAIKVARCLKDTDIENILLEKQKFSLVNYVRTTMKLSTYGMWEQPRQKLVCLLIEHTKLTEQQIHDVLLGPVITTIVETAQSYRQKNPASNMLETHRKALETVLSSLVNELNILEESITNMVDQFIQEALAISEKNGQYLKQLEILSIETKKTQIAKYYGKDFSSTFPELASKLMSNDPDVLKEAAKIVSKNIKATCPHEIQSLMIEHIKYMNEIVEQKLLNPQFNDEFKAQTGMTMVEFKAQNRVGQITGISATAWARHFKSHPSLPQEESLDPVNESDCHL